MQIMHSMPSQDSTQGFWPTAPRLTEGEKRYSGLEREASLRMSKEVQLESFGIW